MPLTPNPEHQALLAEITPLPVTGRSWPKGVAYLACAVLILIGIRLMMTAASDVGQQVNPFIAGTIMVCYAALIVIARFMLVGQTTISAHGISQQWIMRRDISWEEIRSAKFIPMLFSKRLVCFTHRGRPVIFQGATPDLQIAFAKISLVYKRRL